MSRIADYASAAKRADTFGAFKKVAVLTAALTTLIMLTNTEPSDLFKDNTAPVAPPITITETKIPPAKTVTPTTEQYEPEVINPTTSSPTQEVPTSSNNDNQTGTTKPTVTTTSPVPVSPKTSESSPPSSTTDSRPFPWPQILPETTSESPRQTR